MPVAKLILTTDPRTGDVTALNPGQPVLDWPRHAPHKYSKCAYSTRFGFCVSVSVATPEEGGLDNGFSLSDDGQFFRIREHCLDPEVDHGVAFSRWQPWPDVEVRTWLIAEPTGHLRVHHLRTGRKLWTLEAGFAVGWNAKTTLKITPAEPTVRTPDGASALRNLLGQREGGTADLGANSHLLSTLSTMPVLRSLHEPGEHWLACWVSGSADPNDDFHIAAEFSANRTQSGFCIHRNQKPWWMTSDDHPCGASDLRRLIILKTLV